MGFSIFNNKFDRLVVFLLGCLAIVAFGLLSTFTKNQDEEFIRKTYEENVSDCLKMSSSKRGVFCLSMSKPFIGGNEFFFGKICAGLEAIVGASSVVDFGSSFGQYGRCLTRKLEPLNSDDMASNVLFMNRIIAEMKGAGIFGKPRVIKRWEGYDGSIGVEEITNGFVKYLDLSIPFSLGRKFDWVVSTEVGEHIPKEFEDVFLDNIVAHACKGVILSWAVEGQGGHNHVNNHSNDYIIAKMKERDMEHDLKAQTLIRTFAQTYFKNTLMVFTKIEPTC